jgi:ABC-type transporter Mla maintaining outer membrane lipid asymmetry ATPase subunit MlaF
MTAPEVLVELAGVVKDYQALRPLRIVDLRVTRGAVVSVSGPDALAAEVLVNLMTAAMRPDSGSVRLFGRSTESIDDYEGWLAMLDGLGLLTERAVLLDQCSIAQNLALPLTLEIEPIRADVLPQVEALADEVGIPREAIGQPVGGADPTVLQRLRLARALALDPRLVVAEHPTASLPRASVPGFARDLARIVAKRGAGLLAISVDREFVRALGGTALTHDPSTGVLTRPGLLARLGLG